MDKERDMKTPENTQIIIDAINKGGTMITCINFTHQPNSLSRIKIDLVTSDVNLVKLLQSVSLFDLEE